MARTKASVGAKVSSTKSTKARAAAPPPSPSPRAGGGPSSSSRSSLSGGNPVCPRETPAWQLPITRFFHANERADAMDTDDAPDQAAGPSGASRPRRRNVIESDDECDPITVAADVSIHEADLPPLDGEACHKIAEYFPKRQDQRVGAAEVERDPSEDKENVEVERRGSGKREREDGEVSVNKKVKVSF